MVRTSAIVLLALIFVFGGYHFFDLKQAFDFYGEVIFPSHPLTGTFIVLSFLMLSIFSEEVWNFFKKIKQKIKLK